MMKATLILCLTLYSYAINAQCKDVYGSKIDCPTAQDSLVVYNNALKVVDFYDNNPSYKITGTEELTNNEQIKDVFETLIQARRMFTIIRREIANMKPDKFSVGKVSSRYKDISYSEYYQNIDEYRFYQRELENQIINATAPMPIYDTRINPILVNTYKCQDTSSIYFGDLVNIPLYVPVTVKPVGMLTETELMLRNKILHLPMPIKHMVKRDSTNYVVVNDTIKPLVNYKPLHKGVAIYFYNAYGSASVIGFMANHKFIKLRHEQYPDYAVQKFARDLLEDDKLLDSYLRLKFGTYYEGITP